MSIQATNSQTISIESLNKELHQVPSAFFKSEGLVEWDFQVIKKIIDNTYRLNPKEMAQAAKISILLNNYNKKNSVLKIANFMFADPTIRYPEKLINLIKEQIKLDNWLETEKVTPKEREEPKELLQTDKEKQPPQLPQGLFDHILSFSEIGLFEKLEKRPQELSKARIWKRRQDNCWRGTAKNLSYTLPILSLGQVKHYVVQELLSEKTFILSLDPLPPFKIYRLLKRKPTLENIQETRNWKVDRDTVRPCKVIVEELFDRAPQRIGDLFRIVHIGLLPRPMVYEQLLSDCNQTHELAQKFPQILEKSENFPTLQSLQFSSLQLSTLSVDIGKLTSVTSLFLNNNRLKSLPRSICNLVHLKNIVVSDNLLTEFPGFISDLIALEEIHLGRNHITSIDEVIFGNLPQLKVFHLNDNRISSLPETLSTLQNLKEFDTSNNLLSTLPLSFTTMTSLESLNLAGNQLVALSKSFGNLVSLEHLNLSHNKISSLPKSFGNLVSLRRLNLSHNKLSLPESFDNLVSFVTKINSSHFKR